MMSRQADVEIILRSAKQQHADLQEGYDKALHDESLDLRVPVKNLMENLRSALDYVAHDIYEIYCRPARKTSAKAEPRNIYFPYGRSETDFKSVAGNSLPGLDTLAPRVFELICSVQPFQCGDSWLYDLCTILNEKKHDRLTPQLRNETDTYSVSSEMGSVTIQVDNPSVRIRSIPGAVRIFGVPAQFTERGIVTPPTDKLRHTLTKWVAFTFEGSNVNVLGLLNKAVPGVEELSKKLYMEISIRGLG